MKISIDVLDDLIFVKTHNIYMEGDVPFFTACCEVVGKDDKPSGYIVAPEQPARPAAPAG